MKVGVALGGGGVRGLTHAMALEVIESCGITPHMISGTSMGAIIGALFASGISGKEIREGIEKNVIPDAERVWGLSGRRREMLRWLSFARPSLSKSGMIHAGGLLNWLMKDIEVETFEELQIPLQIMATDFHSGEPHVFSKGPLLPAIQASMAIPGIFVPVEHNGRILVDGGLVDNVPYDLLEADCDFTIAIDVSPTRDPDSVEVPNLLTATIGMFDILVDEATRLRLLQDPPDIYIRPVIEGIRIFDFEKIGSLFEQVQPAMDQLRTQIELALKKQAESESL
ncbi:MAG: patatin-like phospholipase family protein [Verrucomicrobiales bacterium]|nr:patatin-like phospholipase family protein [Verrucomicrobiales bacterium]